MHDVPAPLTCRLVWLATSPWLSGGQPPTPARAVPRYHAGRAVVWGARCYGKRGAAHGKHTSHRNTHNVTCTHCHVRAGICSPMRCHWQRTGPPFNLTAACTAMGLCCQLWLRIWCTTVLLCPQHAVIHSHAHVHTNVHTTRNQLEQHPPPPHEDVPIVSKGRLEPAHTLDGESGGKAITCAVRTVRAVRAVGATRDELQASAEEGVYVGGDKGRLLFGPSGLPAKTRRTNTSHQARSAHIERDGPPAGRTATANAPCRLSHETSPSTLQLGLCAPCTPCQAD